MNVFEDPQYPRYHIELELHRVDGKVPSIHGHHQLAHAAALVVGIDDNGDEVVLKDKREVSPGLRLVASQEHINHTRISSGIAAAHEHINTAKRDLDDASKDQLERGKWTNRELAIFLQTHLLDARAALATATRAIAYMEKHLAQVIEATEPKGGDGP